MPAVLRAYLELVRPANVVTALADVLAGYAVAGLGPPRVLPWLLTATACLYAGGIAFNDVFDRRLDARERPERPIPSGRVTVKAAAWLGGSLLTVGLVAGFIANGTAGRVALAIVASVLLYDGFAKRHELAGPLTMGMCRALNLLLGISAAPAILAHEWPLAAIPLAYVTGVTMLSRGEVTGGTRAVAFAVLGLLLAVLMALAALALQPPEPSPIAVLLVLFLTWRVVPPFWRACERADPLTIRRAVRSGVLSLVLVDAVIGAAYAGMIHSLTILATAVLATALARRFAVT
jgi:4-hydroxybenzoate polyprenyltransferase